MGSGNTCTFVYDRGIIYSFLSKEISCARSKPIEDRKVLPAITIIRGVCYVPDISKTLPSELTSMGIVRCILLSEQCECIMLFLFILHAAVSILPAVLPTSSTLVHSNYPQTTDQSTSRYRSYISLSIPPRTFPNPLTIKSTSLAQLPLPLTSTESCSSSHIIRSSNTSHSLFLSNQESLTDRSLRVMESCS